MEYYRRSNPVQHLVPTEAPEVPHGNLMEDPKVEVIGVFPAKSSIKMMIQDSFKKTYGEAHMDDVVVLEPTKTTQDSFKKIYEEDETDDIIILEPASTTVPSIKSEPISKIKLRKLVSGENLWDFGQTGKPSVVTPAPSSPSAVPKPEFSFPTFKDEPGEYVEVPPPPEITLSGLQDWESKPQPWDLHLDSTGNGLLPSKLDKRKK